MDPNTVYVLESRLISMDGATQIPISEFEARIDGTTQKFVSLLLYGFQEVGCLGGLIYHYFHIIGDGHQPNSRRLYTHYL